MIYSNSEMRLDVLIQYINDDKINLSPVFQRGHVWPVTTRRKLIKNIVQGRPIPAIFIYKELSGSRYTYNILDGKQRIESLILFIGSQQTAGENPVSIRDWAKYFQDPKDRKHVDFFVELPAGRKKFKQLDSATIAELGEYRLSTIEITMTDGTTLDEIIDLFVDINQEGEPVNRFDVVKAIGLENPLLQSVFDLIARREDRQRDVYYKPKDSDFTKVLKKLSLIAKIPARNAQVDRMWERLLEVVSFVRTRKHRAPVEILKSFIRTRTQTGTNPEQQITGAEMRELRKTFAFLKQAYRAGVSQTPLATDQTHFYTMITTIISQDRLSSIAPNVLTSKLLRLGNLIANPSKKNTPLGKRISEYIEASRKQTTHFGRREARETLFGELLDSL